VGCLAMDLNGAVAAGELSLLERVEAYLQRHGVKPSCFGVGVVNSPSLVRRMRDGKGLRQATVERIELFIAAPWPYYQSQGMRSSRSMAAKRYAKAVQKNQEAEQAERLRRTTDPVELAATFLRIKGWMVVRARVIDETATGWAVGRLRVDDAGLLQRARDKGWRG
jgi:hypothetical protein